MKNLFNSAYRVPVLAVSVAILVALLGNIVGAMHADKTLATLDLSQDTRADVEVYLDFEPERFHLERFQEVGRYLGWREGYAVILKADPDELRALARNYWVTKITEHVEAAS